MLVGGCTSPYISDYSSKTPFRQPESSLRPTFPQLVELLSRTDFELFVWEEEDLIGSDPQVKMIGAPLEVAKNLYPELQRSYQT